MPFAAALGHDLGCRTPADALDECARLAPLFAGISHHRLDREGRAALALPLGRRAPGEARLYQQRFATAQRPSPPRHAAVAAAGRAADAEFPFLLVTGRRLMHYNAGTMTRRTANVELQRGETLDIHPDDANRLALRDGERVEVASRRGTIVAPVRLTDDVAPGEVFLAFHFPDVATNVLTSQAVDDVTSCPEYKVTAVQLRNLDG